MDEDLSLDAAMDSVGREMGLQDQGSAPQDGSAQEGSAQGAAQREGRSPPSAWPKEMHEHWHRLDPKVQDFAELREKQILEGLMQYKEAADLGRSWYGTIEPFLPDIQAAFGGNPQEAVRTLLAAERALRTGTPEQKRQMLQRLAQDYGIDLGSEAPYEDPTVKAITDRLDRMESSLVAERQAQIEAARKAAEEEVTAFASDPAHRYFAEVSDHIVLLLQNPAITLEQAYEQAVWANPATRAKEQARLQEEARRQAEEKAKNARAAKGTRVQGVESDRAPTEPLGSMDETLRATLKEIRSRTH